MRKLLLSIFFCLLLAVQVRAQEAEVDIIGLNLTQDYCSVGDTITVKIIVTTPPQICIEGMDKAKIYLSGLSLLEEMAWQVHEDNVWTKEASYIVISNKKKKAKITVIRKADKGDFFQQKVFEIK